MILPSIDDLVDAQHAIDRQFPALAKIPAGEAVDVRLTARHLATIASALGVTTGAVRKGASPTPAQVGWAAIIDGGLVARGAPRLDRSVVEALERCKLDELEKMAELVLEGGGLCPLPRREAPDTPESVADKCRAGRAVADAFREHIVQVKP